MTKNKIDFNVLSVDELKKKLESSRAELFSLRLGAATAPVKDYSQFKKLRKTIAQSLTLLSQKLSAKV